MGWGYTRPSVADPSALRALESDDGAALTSLSTATQQLREQVARSIVGQQTVVDLLITCLFARGHALFVGVPGLGKTLLVSSLAQALELAFARIQFTPDLMPTDITGSEVLEEDPQTGQRGFRFVRGPVFCNLLLADEINRTPPKTQAALLQAMQEQRVTAGAHTHDLPRPFHVFATQNPIEQEGTYPLPEAQLDRFMLQIIVDYPDEAAEREIVTRGRAPATAIEPVLTPDALIRFQAFIERIPVPPSIVDHIVQLVRSTRPSPEAPAIVQEMLQYGAGPRAGQQLLLAAQAHAAMNGRGAVSIADVVTLAPAVIEHRLVRSFAAETRGVSTSEIMAELLRALPRP